MRRCLTALYVYENTKCCQVGVRKKGSTRNQKNLKVRHEIQSFESPAYVNPLEGPYWDMHMTSRSGRHPIRVTERSMSSFHIKFGSRRLVDSRQSKGPS